MSDPYGLADLGLTATERSAFENLLQADDILYAREILRSVADPAVLPLPVDAEPADLVEIAALLADAATGFWRRLDDIEHDPPETRIAYPAAEAHYRAMAATAEAAQPIVAAVCREVAGFFGRERTVAAVTLWFPIAFEQLRRRGVALD